MHTYSGPMNERVEPHTPVLIPFLDSTVRDVYGRIFCCSAAVVSPSAIRRLFSRLMSGGTAKANTSSTPLTDLTILTWNVWFDQIEYRQRMDHILNLTLEHRPDVACFQEVLLEFADMISKHPVVKDLYHVSPFITGGYGVLTIVKKEYNPRFSFVEFPSRMGRELLKATFEKDQHPIVVGNVHLESQGNRPTRAEQLKICGKELNGAQLPILVGDFNFCSERNFVRIEGESLENDILTTTLPEFQDLWKLSVARTSPPDPNHNSDGENEIFSTPKKAARKSESSLGYTFDSQANPMILQEERMRYDRIMAKLGQKYSFVEMKMLGTDPIDPNAVNLVRSTPVTGLWPSDHFGLIATIRTRQPLTLTVDSPERMESQGSNPSRPPNPFKLSENSLPALKHVEGTIVTNRDGSRMIEKIDPITGIIRHESLPNVASVLPRECQELQCKSEAVQSLTLPGDQYLSAAEIEERLFSILTKAVSLSVPVRLLAIDYDATICQVHTYGRWQGTAASLSSHTRPVFRALLRIADTFPSLRLAVVTFSGQCKLIREVLQDCLGRNRAERVFIRGSDRSWTPPRNTPCMEGKQPHIASIIEDLFFQTGELLSAEQVLLIDDDQKNIDFAKLYSHRALTFPSLPLHGIQVTSVPEASGVRVHRRYPLLHGSLLCISEGTVVNFQGYQHGAIVNAANSGGVTGGGVDGAVTMAGGEKLMQARLSLPIIPGTRADRIPCGDCRVTGPNKFGQLMVPVVIHAVGPNYCLLEGIMKGEGKDPESALKEGDALLESAYVSSMKACQERTIELVGFSLLSSGVFRGRRSLDEVLRIALTAVSGSVYAGLREVHLIAFTDEELSTLIEIAEGSRGLVPAPILIGPGSAQTIRQFLTDLDGYLS